MHIYVTHPAKKRIQRRKTRSKLTPSGTHLVIHVDEIVIQVESELKAVGQTHLHIPVAAVYGVNGHSLKIRDTP